MESRGAEGSARVLVVDDEPSITVALSTSLRRHGYECITASSADEALKRLRIDEPDLVISDVRMPGMTGLELLKRAKSRDPDTQFIVMTAYSEIEFAVEALRNQADDYLLKPFDLTELAHTVSRALEHRRLVRENRAFRERDSRDRGSDRSRRRAACSTLASITRRVEIRDGYDPLHIDRIVRGCLEIGRELGLDPETLATLELAATCHDIGKLSVPESILCKSDPLTAEERARIEEHADAGARWLEAADGMQGAACSVRHHHEAWDGSGYPDGLRAERIPSAARILSVVDAFEAMTHDRPYRPGRPAEDAVAEMQRLAGTRYDPEIVRIFETVRGRLS